ncbi:Lachesin [Gryllus bimaculatus]|nr:Lachesin [Gryllus bimaculatus]
MVMRCAQVGWMKAEDQTILTLHTKVVTHNSRISVSQDNMRTWQLHIRQVKETDRGCYMCQINTSVMKKQVGCVDVHVDSFSNDSLTLIKLDRKQMGAYLCIASNEVPPAVSKRITLNINFAPVIKVPNQLLGAPLGTDVQLECYVEAFPNTINYWVKNRGEMLLDG